ncbi:MAG: C40 family peptidase [Deltaproteobacteria bacterium]|nr:C40 family peptidase [Deltaproteobacteria bacterium]
MRFPSATSSTLRALAALSALPALLALAACTQGAGQVTPRGGDGDARGVATDAGAAATAEEAGESGACPELLPAPTPLPGIRDEQRTLAYWLARVAAYGPPDEVLLSAGGITDHDRALQLPVDGWPLGWSDLAAPEDPHALQSEIASRLRSVRDDMASGRYVDRNGTRFPEDALAALDPPAQPPPPRDEWRVALASLPLHCGPRLDGLYTEPVDPAFDRNICGSARPQELVRIVAAWDGGLLVARTASAFGWIPDDAPLSPPAPDDRRELLSHGPRARIAGPTHLVSADGAAADLPEGTIAPLVEGSTDRVWFATSDGLHQSEPVAAGLRPTHRDLTRAAVLEEAFSRLGEPYGWGGRDGGLDCSGFVQEVFAAFDLGLPRNSGRQALAGTFSIDVASLADSAKKLRLLEAAARRGVVLLHIDGHIMLYLGLAEDDTPMAIHSFSEYLQPCGAGDAPGKPAETRRRADRVDVSDLSLGAGSSKGSFLERIDRFTVLGRGPGPDLEGAAELRAAAPVDVPDGDACDDSTEVRVFRSPRVPNAANPMRVIVTTARELGPVELALLDPDGNRQTVDVHRLAGPPYTWWARVEAPVAGEWTAVLGDGSRVDACERFRVARGPHRPELHPAETPPWRPAWSWERDTDNLYAAFVEQLFREPAGEDVTWPDLQTLLRDPERNLLYDHLGLGEDEKLQLAPDCAGLAYVLRAYFSWKLKLPFAFRRCTRGRADAPPSCGEFPQSNLHPDAPPEPEDGGAAPLAVPATPAPGTPPASDLPADIAPEAPRPEVEVFADFVTRVENTIHSGTARTAPDSDATDLYPVALTRESLPPGTVYADPYGHTLIIVAWVPERADAPGMLLAADAQPDGTVGRRRFWRGTFLFTPDTTASGAGFKAWRPPRFEHASGTIVVPTNAELAVSDEHVRWSNQQYSGSADDFYDGVESLINPRPLDPNEALVVLVDALEEAAVRRVVSVANGETYAAEHPGVTIPMPEGHDIFETSGAWEDYATPSRDMRLLIALDTVRSFPDAVARRPELYGLDSSAVPSTVDALHTALDTELAARQFAYTRSDASTWTLTLAELLARSPGLEVAYNPNDCVEVRWAAPEGSDEHSTCVRRAPPAQLALMAEYRAWFHDRTRPPR